MYTIKQVSELTGISSHTLRYYDKEGLFPVISRSANNIRLFSDEGLEWVHVIHCFRETGLSISDIKKYIELSNQGEHTLEARLKIILDTKAEAEQELLALQKRLQLLNKKVAFYKNLMETKS